MKHMRAVGRSKRNFYLITITESLVIKIRSLTTCLTILIQVFQFFIENRGLYAV
jgi:hypothetical protein